MISLFLRRVAQISGIFILTTVAGFTGLTGCGGNAENSGTTGGGLTPTVRIAQPSAANIDPGDSVKLSATVTNDTNAAGVTWALSGSGCTGSACGALSNTTTTAATYTAPATVSGPLTVTVTATSVAKSSAKGTMNLTVPVNPAISTATGALTSGMVGTAYSDTLGASGGITPYKWSLTQGTLPAGLILNGATGAISGTPTTAGNISFTAELTDSGSAALTSTVNFSISIAAAPAIVFSTTSLANATLNTTYSAQMIATGGSGALTYTLASGSLPSGLRLSSAGAITGTANTAGVSTFAVKATDTYGDSGTSGSLSITVGYPSLAITTSSLPAATYKVAYSATLTASGGSGTGFTWSLVSGAFPTGVSLSAGVISGTPTTTGSFSVKVQVTDSASNTATATLSLIVSYPALSITSTSLSAGIVGTAYSQTLSATGGSGTGYTYTVTAGTGLSGAGLSLSTAGVISGTPGAAETSAPFTVQVTDSASNTATAQLTLTIYPSLTVVTTSLPAGTVGTAYSSTLAASGGTGTGFAWTITSGATSLSSIGLSLSSTGAITGTPTGPETAASFTVTVTDSGSHTAAATLAITANYPTLSITNTALPGGTVNTLYSQTISAQGGSGKGYTWTVTSGASSLASINLSLSSAGVLSGTPAAAGSATFTVKVTDSASNTATATYTITVYTGLTITTTSLPNAIISQSYSANLLAAGGSGAGYTWIVKTGSLPAGLSLSTAGIISGSPTTAGTASFTIQVTDSASNTATASLAINVYSALTITTTTLPSGTISAAYSSTVHASGGSGTGYAWTVTSGASSLTAINLSLSGAGLLSGTPASTGSASFTIKVTDSVGNTAAASYTVTIYSALTISTSSLPNAITTQSYSTTLAASGGSGTGYTWVVKTGSLPAGLSLSSAGVISGSATTPGTVSFTIQVTDSVGNAATVNLAINVYAQLRITSSTPPGITVSVAYSSTFAASGGSGGYSWSETGTLPSGITLSAGGMLSGTTTQTGSYPITVKVTDSATETATASYTLVVSNALVISTSSLPNAIVSQGYSTTLAATGGSATGYNWIVKTGSLPSGLSLSSAGVITGSPTTTGTVSFTVQVTDSASNTATANLAINVYNVLTIVTTTLPSGTVNVAYAQTLQASGGSGGYTWTVTSGASSLTALNLSLSSAGALSGTPATSGSTTFTVKVTDSTSETATATLSVTFNATLAITTASLPNATTGTAYSTALAAVGGTGNGYTWSLKSGGLPGGMGLSAAGAITGTPSSAGTANFTVQVTDSGSNSATANLSITVNGPLTLIYNGIPPATTNYPYSAQLGAAGGTGTGYIYSILSGAAPSGITMNSSGQISGTTAVTSGNFTFTVQVKDSGNNTASQAYTISVYSTLTIVSTGLPSGSTGQSYLTYIQAAGGSGTGYVYTLTSGSLPPGLTLTQQGNSGPVSGTPTSTGTYNFTIGVTDSNSNTASASLSITINSPQPLTIQSNDNGNAEVDFLWSQNSYAGGGTGPYTITVTGGTVPSWITINPAANCGTNCWSNVGQLWFTGTPAAGDVGTVNFTLQVADSSTPTAQTATQAYSFTVSAVDSSHNSELKGTYAFEVQGWHDGSNDGTTTQTALIGSLVFDGNGNITSGEADQNDEVNGYKSVTGITGTYSVGANNLGMLVLNAGGGQNPIAIAVGGITGGIATKARIMQYTDIAGIGDPSGNSAGDAKRTAGTMLLQTSADFTSSALTGGYAFTLYGETPCPTCVSATTYGPITAAGVFSANGTGGITTGEEDVTTASTSTTAMTLSGSYGTPDASGRVVASIAQSGYTIGAWPTNYVFYIVNAQTVFLMSTDSHATTTLLAGRALQQQVSSFTNNNLSGNSVLLISEPGGGYVSGFGTSSSSSSSNASVGLVTATPGTAQLSVTIQQNSGAQSQTLTYSVAANGRMTLSGGGGSSPVFYLVNTNQGFGTDLSSGGQHGGLLTMEPQIGSSFSTSTLSGNYIYSNDTLIVPEMSNGVGVATIASGNVTPTGDTSDADGTLYLNTPQGTIAYTVDSSTGLITLGGSGGSIGYIVSSSEVVFIDTSTGNTNPSVTILEQ